MITRQFWSGIIVGAILLFGIMYLASQKHEEPVEDSTHAYLFKMATNGSHTAIVSLYNYEKNRGEKEYSMYWAREGALVGIDELKNDYIGMYRSLDNVRKKQEVEVIRKNINMSGARSLLDSIGSGP